MDPVKYQFKGILKMIGHTNNLPHSSDVRGCFTLMLFSYDLLALNH